MKNKSVLFLTEFSILVAIEAIFCFTPLGSLPALGPIVATLAMIPVIITALFLGTKAGTAMGAIAGLFSFIVWTFMPPTPAVAFVFTPFYTLGEIHGNFGSLLICFVPRILVGTVAGATYKGLSKLIPNKDVLNMVIASAAGSLINTFGVMGGVWLFFAKQYEVIAGQVMILNVGATILTSGIPEAIVSSIVAPAVCKPLKTIMSRTRKEH
jgi:uncharacterized membrane protein